MLRIQLLLVMLLLGSARAAEPMADAHMHYNWNQVEGTTPEEAIAIWRENDVVLAVVAGTPPDLALRLREAGGEWVVPIWSPYLDAGYRNNWFRRSEVLEAGRKAMESGAYHGIGEVHLVPGLGPRRDNPVFQGLIELATAYDVPFMVHTDASSHRFLLPVCRQHPKTRFVWAHAGGILPPDEVAALLDGCPNVVADLTARDPKRYVLTPIADESGHLLPEWRELVLAYPDRFMVGSDAVWPVDQMHSWYQDDTGWALVGEFLDFHRGWIADLPEQHHPALLLDNARRVWVADGR